MPAPAPLRLGPTTVVEQLTGADVRNRTAERFGIHGTDLGILWDAGDGRVMALFGDTYGPGWGGHGAGPATAQWRRNVLLWSRTRDLSAGMDFDGGLVADLDPEDDSDDAPDSTNEAVQMLASGWRWLEHTRIPNGGVAVDGRQIVHWMSVRVWLGPGRWNTGLSGLAFSDDGGRTWRAPWRRRWINWTTRNRFQVGALTLDRTGQWLHLVATPNGRFGDAHLARVPARQAETAPWEYWTGHDWRRGQRHAGRLFGGPVGEMDVKYHAASGHWLAMHLDERRSAIVLREAPEITGPWSEGQVVVSGADVPALYGGYLHPWSLDGGDLYWIISQWGPYNVFLMRTPWTAS